MEELYNNEILLEEIKYLLITINDNFVNLVEILLIFAGILIGFLVGYLFIRVITDGS